MTANARRYGRWCRQHFDAPAEPRKTPEPQPEAKKAEPQPAKSRTDKPAR